MTCYGAGPSGWQTDVMDGQPAVEIDLDAITANVTALAAHVGGPQVMAVVKSDGYGHGMLPAAAAALAGGASWLGVVQLADAIALRQAHPTTPVLCLVGAHGAAHRQAIEAGVDLTVGTVGLAQQIAATAQTAGRPARIHLEADTGMGRGGATAADWPGLVEAAREFERAGQVQIAGIWSHFACADLPGHQSIPAQLTAFRAAVDLARQAGAEPEVVHLANTPATLTIPESWFDLVRPGGAVFGLSTLPGGAPPWLRPAMTVRARLLQTKRVPAGSGISYGHRHVTSAAATIGVIPLGYNEGLPRLASSRAQVLVGGRRVTIAGTVNMNHTMIDVGDLPVQAGDEVILFGPGDAGEPTAQDWADALGTLSYEIVTRFTGKIPRSYSGVTKGQDRVLAVGRATASGATLGGADEQVAATH
jgi:alanine racemase